MRRPPCQGAGEHVARQQCPRPRPRGRLRPGGGLKGLLHTSRGATSRGAKMASENEDPRWLMDGPHVDVVPLEECVHTRARRPPRLAPPDVTTHEALCTQRCPPPPPPPLHTPTRPRVVDSSSTALRGRAPPVWRCWPALQVPTRLRAVLPFGNVCRSRGVASVCVSVCLCVYTFSFSSLLLGAPLGSSSSTCHTAPPLLPNASRTGAGPCPALPAKTRPCPCLPRTGGPKTATNWTTCLR